VSLALAGSADGTLTYGYFAQPSVALAKEEVLVDPGRDRNRVPRSGLTIRPSLSFF
jgi:hypothetical protein